MLDPKAKLGIDCHCYYLLRAKTFQSELWSPSARRRLANSTERVATRLEASWVAVQRDAPVFEEGAHNVHEAARLERRAVGLGDDKPIVICRAPIATDPPEPASVCASLALKFRGPVNSNSSNQRLAWSGCPADHLQVSCGN